VPAAALGTVLFFAGVGLDGRLRPVPGVLPAVTAAQAAGFGAVVLAAQSAAGAALVPGIRVIAASSLTADDVHLSFTRRVQTELRFHSPAARALPWGCDNWVPSRRGRVRAAGGWGLVAGAGLAGARWKVHSCAGVPLVVAGSPWTVGGRKLDWR